MHAVATPPDLVRIRFGKGACPGFCPCYGSDWKTERTFFSDERGREAGADRFYLCHDAQMRRRAQCRVGGDIEAQTLHVCKT
jgi:hypothetical protein